MLQTYVENNKLLTVFDVVNFVGNVESNKLNISSLKDLEDYRVVLTHGVIGELMFLLENDCYGLDKSKIIICSNNIQTTNFFIKNGFNSHTINEYIFTNDDLYNIDKNCEKKYDCIFPGRLAKSINLFQRPYNINLLKLFELKEYPIPRHIVPKYYNESKCGLMTTESEGSCLSVGEMLCCGIPVVSVKINNINKENYYPINKNSYKATYDLVLPNTLGGRELWFDEENCIICFRNDNDIEKSINELIEKNYQPEVIRNNFLAKLWKERLNFLFLLKDTCDDLSIKFDKNIMHTICNLPYGNSTLSSTQWKNVNEYFFKII